jgi:MerR family transcriptional regulator, light-induced transcriptional regulator
MQAFNSDLLLTTSEAAALLGVHPSTVKRWSDRGGLSATKTPGGHRRIHLRSALEFGLARGAQTYLTPFSPYESHVWLAFRDAEGSGDFRRVRSLALGWLLRGYPRRITALIHELVGRPGLSLEGVCDGAIRPFMEEVGLAWKEGRLRIGDEHLASQAVLEALFRLAGPEGTATFVDTEENGTTGTRPRLAVVGATEGDHHQIGSLCVRLLLEQEGWRVLHLGPDTPVEEFADIQRTRGAGLVCISVSPPAGPARIRRALDVLREFYRPERPYHLVFGGSGIGTQDDPGPASPFLSLRIMATATALTNWLRSVDGPSAPVEAGKDRAG